MLSQRNMVLLFTLADVSHGCDMTGMSPFVISVPLLKLLWPLVEVSVYVVRPAKQVKRGLCAWFIFSSRMDGRQS